MITTSILYDFSSGSFLINWCYYTFFLATGKHFSHSYFANFFWLTYSASFTFCLFSFSHFFSIILCSPFCRFFVFFSDILSFLEPSHTSYYFQSSSYTIVIIIVYTIFEIQSIHLTVSEFYFVIFIYIWLGILKVNWYILYFLINS